MKAPRTACVTGPDRTCATWSLRLERNASSPGDRWLKKGGRQPKEMVDGGGGHPERQLGLQPQDQRLLECGEDELHQCSKSDTDEDRRHPSRLLTDQERVHERTGQCRQGDARSHQEQAREHDVGDVRPAVAEPAEQRGQYRRTPAPGHEGGGPFSKVRAIPVKPLVELISADHTRPRGGVVDEDLVATEALDHEEVVEAPENNQGQVHGAEPRGFSLPGVGDQALLTRRSHEIGRVCYRRARSRKRPRSFIEWHEFAVVGEDHAERTPPRTRSPPSAARSGCVPAADAPPVPADSRWCS